MLALGGALKLGRAPQACAPQAPLVALAATNGPRLPGGRTPGEPPAASGATLRERQQSTNADPRPGPTSRRSVQEGGCAAHRHAPEHAGGRQSRHCSAPEAPSRWQTRDSCFPHTACHGGRLGSASGCSSCVMSVGGAQPRPGATRLETQTTHHCAPGSLNRAGRSRTRRHLPQSAHSTHDSMAASAGGTGSRLPRGGPLCFSPGANSGGFRSDSYWL